MPNTPMTEQYADLIIAETRAGWPAQKKTVPPSVFLAQNEEIQQLIARFQAQPQAVPWPIWRFWSAPRFSSRPAT